MHQIIHQGIHTPIYTPNKEHFELYNEINGLIAIN